MVSLLLEKQMINHDDLAFALFGPAAKDNATAPLFRVGERVRVRPFLSGIEWRRPHLRTPGYIYGVEGTVERVSGRFGDPSFLAFGLEAPHVQLYRIRFLMSDIWPERYGLESKPSGVGNGSEEKGGKGQDSALGSPEEDVVEVEVYEHFLTLSSMSDNGSASRNLESISGAEDGRRLFDHRAGNGTDCSKGESHPLHQHDDHDHIHDPRPEIEERAVRLEGPPRPGKELYRALRSILFANGIVSPGEVRKMVCISMIMVLSC